MPGTLTASAAIAALLAATPAALARTAWYWEARGREAEAAAAWQQVLRRGDRPDALAALGSWHARAGSTGEARALLTRLEHRWPGSVEHAQLERAIAVGKQHAALLARARDAARVGRTEEALARYRELFGRAPPGHLAREYYETCTGVPAALPEAIAGFEALVRKVPAHAPYRLSLARALTYREESRLDGISRLELLARDTITGREADIALRQALSWLAPGPEADRHVARWMERHPDDHELAASHAGRRGGASAPTAAGWVALERGDLKAARRSFEQAGEDDARALAGLAVVALREGDHAAARLFAERARALAPDDPAAWQGPLRAALFWDLVSRGRSEIAAARYDEARRLLAEAAGMPGADRHEAELALAELDEARGARGEAEARLRRLSQARPRDAAVLRRLVDVLARAGKQAEALAENDRLARLAPGAAADLRPLRISELRAQAAAMRAGGDRAGARAALRAARALDGGDPWTIHDLALLALEEGNLNEARRLSERLAGLAPDLPEARLAQARILAATGDAPAALAALDALPAARARDPSLRRRLEVEAAVARAAALPPAAARERLAALEVPPGDPELLAAVARGWRRAGDVRRAAILFREVLRRSPPPARGVTIELAAALAEGGGADAEVAELLEPLRGDPGLSPAERTALRDLSAGLLLRRAEALREAGDPAGALAALSPAMEEKPGDARLLAARGRALLDAGDAEAARSAFADALASDPRSMEAREGAIAAAFARGQESEGRRLAVEAAAGAPRDARAQLLLAQTEARAGDDEAALRTLREARRQRGGGGPEDELDAAIRAEMDRVGARHALDAGGAIALRVREGESGLGALTELRIPASTALPIGLAGRLALTVAQVQLDAGVAELGRGDVAARFGSGAVGPRVGVDAAGIGLAARWEQRSLSADLGVTPVGFPIVNVTGGVRITRDVGPLALALALSRREVTESVLSYAGVRDPASGRLWGGVLRHEARVDAAWNGRGGTRWASLALAFLDGTGVAANTVAGASAGAEWRVARLHGADVRAGVAGSVLGYRHNQRHFTVGQGGYFSPQALLHAGVPLRLRVGGRIPWEVAAELGVNWFREDAAGPETAGRSSAGLALDLSSTLRWPLADRLDARLELGAHRASGYQELRVSLGLDWRVWAPR
jgi:predicted Zn-dependent protease